MARKPRIHFPGALYHVILRGNGGMSVFVDDNDRYRFFFLLQEGIERFRHRVYAYCLMDNHIHLAIQVGEVPLSRIMQNLSFRFTRWINWRHERTGHLFQGRFKAILVETDEYLLQLVAYLHLNPVRAGVVNEPLDYRWSSHRALMGKELIPWLSIDPILAKLSSNRSEARIKLAEFVSSHIPLGHRRDFHGVGSKDSRILGEDRFLNDVLKQADQQPLKQPDIETCIRLVTQYFDCKIDSLRKPGRQQKESRIRAFLAWVVREHSSTNLTELANWLNRDVSTLSSAATRLVAKANQQPEIRQDMDQLQKLISNLATMQA